MRKYLLKKDPEDNRDHLFARPPIALPSKIDLRQGCSPVVNQMALGSCTANAIASGAMEFNQIKAEKPLVLLSRLYLYYKERKIRGTVKEDSGAFIRDGMKVAVKNGVCPEIDMPYDITKFTKKPSVKAERNAKKYRATSYQSLSSCYGFEKLLLIKRCLAEGYPVIFGMNVYPSFETIEVAKTGIAPMPLPEEVPAKCLGAHCVSSVGYEDDLDPVGKPTGAGKIIVRNSWGEKWGDKGYFYLSYEYVQKYCFDFWTLR